MAISDSVSKTEIILILRGNIMEDIRSIRYFLIALPIVLTLYSISVRANNEWGPPITDTSILGGNLEAEYKSFLLSCSISPPLKVSPRFWFGKELSSIPLEIQQQNYIYSKIRFSRSRDLMNMFSHLYTDVEKKNGPNFDSSQQLSQDLTPSEINGFGASIIEGGPSIQRNETCGSIIDAAATIEPGFELPMLTVKAALKSQLNEKRTQYQNIIAGDIKSPWIEGLDETDQATKQYLYVMIWMWYSTHQTLANTPHWLLSDFQGAAVFRQYSSEEGLFITKNLDANENNQAPVNVQANVSINDQESNRASTKIESDNTYVLSHNGENPENQDDFGAFTVAPNPDEISGFVANSGTKSSKVYVRLIGGGITNVHTQTIQGIPRKLCEQQNIWRASIPDEYPEAKAMISSITVSSTAYSIETKNWVPQCTFKIQIIPSAAVVGHVTLGYGIHLTSNKVNGHELIFNADPVELDTVSPPSLSVNDARRGPSWPLQTSELGSVANWSLDLVYTERSHNNVDISTDPVLKDFKLFCDNKELTGQPLEGLNAQYTGNGTSQKGLTIKFTTLFRPDSNRDLKSGSMTDCTVNGKVSFTMQNPAVTMDQDLTNVSIWFPALVKPIVASSAGNDPTTNQTAAVAKPQ